MLTVLTLLWFCHADGSLLWDFRLHTLRQAVSTQNWTEAKCQLDTLEQQNRARFREQRLELTRALVAEHELKWESAFNSYRNDSNERDMLRLLQEAKALAIMGRSQLAIQTMKGIQARHLPVRGQREELRFLLAGQYRKNGETRKSIREYKWVTRNAKRMDLVLPSYVGLIDIYSEKGATRQVRSLSETLQRRWPNSDEALDSVNSQMSSETHKYIQRSAMRMGRVCYQNRAYDKADHLFSLAVERNAKGAWQQALYLKAMIPLKEERPADAVVAFRDALKLLEGSRYEGLLVFQTARALFLLGRDAEVLEWVHLKATTRALPFKWRWETEKLNILALRRLGKVETLDGLWSIYDKEGAPSWLMRFYHQNAMAQSLIQAKPQKALRHLEAMPRHKLNVHEKLELQFWEGLVHRQNGEEQEAIQIWQSLWVGSPNHFFGIASRHMLQQSGMQLPNTKWTQNNDPSGKNPILESKLPSQSPAGQLAKIGRFDWAAWTLAKERNALSGAQRALLKASWFEAANMHHEAIRLTSILKSQYPRGTPLEVLPEEIQKLMYPLGFDIQVQREAQISKVDPFLILAIMREETHFNPVAKSSASARGLMQFIPQTARRVSSKRFPEGNFALPKLYNPDYAISLGAAFLSQLQESFGYISPCSIAAYNAGEGAVEKWNSLSKPVMGDGSPFEFDPLLFILDVTYDETKRYCQKVLTSYYQYRRIYLDETTDAKWFRTPFGS